MTPSDHLSIRWQALGEHYAVCVQCGDPHPYGEMMTARAAANAARQMEQLLHAYQPGMCTHCHTAIGGEPAVVFPEPSLLLPGAPGPDVPRAAA